MVTLSVVLSSILITCPKVSRTFNLRYSTFWLYYDAHTSYYIVLDKTYSPNSEQIMGLNLPTGIPFVYEFDENMKPTVSMQFLGDEATVKAAMEKVAAQTGAKK